MQPLFAFVESDFTDLEGLFEPWQAAPAPAPELLVLNDALAAELGVDADALRTPEGVAVLVGNTTPDGATPVAQAYAGHQFGGYSPRLGDGRALLLGEVRDVHGVRRDLHLKGSGPTPFARGGDGRAAVGPMLREYVMGEAMHALGIPTTRALAVVATGEQIARDTMLPGAVLTRVAGEPPARRHVPVRRPARRPDAAGPPRRPRHRPPPPGRCGCRTPLPGVLRGRRRRPGLVDRAVDARRVHPRRDEHRQHDDLRRDHRLRPVRVHGRLRPGHGVQLHRPRRSLRATGTSPRSPSGTWPGWPRRCSRCSAPTPTARWPR